MSEFEQVLSIKPGYVLVERPAGYEVTLSDQSLRLRDIARMCHEADCRNVLVVGQKSIVRLSTMDVFKLGEQIAELGLRVAVVESHDAPPEDVRFLEDVSTNRGGPLQFFDNEQDARNWLDAP